MHLVDWILVAACAMHIAFYLWIRATDRLTAFFLKAPPLLLDAAFILYILHTNKILILT